MEHKAPKQAGDSEAELQALRREIEVLKVKLAQTEEVGIAVAKAMEEDRVLQEKLEETQDALRKAHAANRRELEEISRVISRFLPHEYPLTGGLRVAAHCRPCHDFGGDIYDFVELRDGRVAICMADVAGHGATAMIAMATVRALLRAVLVEVHQDVSAADILLKLSHWFQDQLEPEQFVTMWLGIWNPGDEKLRFASAAHPRAVLWRAEEEPEFLDTPYGLPLGLACVEPEPYEECVIDLNLFDRIFLYTDGWVESASVDGTTLEGNGFLDFIANAYGQPLMQVPAVLFMLLERHAANSKIRDDVSLLVFDRME
ncbi:MAG: phosphoserine phosphatase RsbU/P [Candidatus Sumerlaeota bacterium]|nr:phosphoserine phosphatase RsbU/P [Candidatus Sumerlaeota bacterium]